MANSIKDRAVLVRLKESIWMGGIVDPKVSRKIMSDNNAQKSVGHFWKRLVPTAAIRPIANAGNACRAFHNKNTLPWMEGGVRILPVAMYDEYMAGIRKLIAAAEVETKKFIKEYPSWVEEARKTHGKLFDESQFPQASELKHRFGLALDVIPLPNVNDWRVDLSEEQAADLKRQAEATMAAVSKEGLLELYSGLHGMLEHCKERLSDPDAKFKNSLIKNIREMVDRMAKMNVMGDKELEAIRKETEEQFKNIDPEELRDNKEKRAKVAKDAGAIMKKMALYMKG